MRKFSLIMLAANIAALVLGIVAASGGERFPGAAVAPLFGAFFLVAFSAAAYFLDFGRLYVYGLMLGLAPLVGEWRWVRDIASHRGFPVTFGTTAAAMTVVGLVLFIRLLRGSPLPEAEGLSSEEA